MEFTGVIFKGYSGFYYVLGQEDNRIWECSLRGKFRLKKQTFLPGDRVICTKTDQLLAKAVIEEVLPRRSELLRPHVANVEQVVIVLALANPEPDLCLLDRIIIMALNSNVKPIICFNKVDLREAKQVFSLQKNYEKTGFPVLVTSTVKGWGIQELKDLMQNKISVFAGPSGVGKSSLLNSLEEGLSLNTGEVSKKISRGRHTTRHVELISLSGGGLLADTPGFSRLYLPKELKREDLVNYYPDFCAYVDLCRFHTCLHKDEPDCGVREAVTKGNIANDRYERYLEILAEVMAEERRF